MPGDVVVDLVWEGSGALGQFVNLPEPQLPYCKMPTVIDPASGCCEDKIR